MFFKYEQSAIVGHAQHPQPGFVELADSHPDVVAYFNPSPPTPQQIVDLISAAKGAEEPAATAVLLFVQMLTSGTLQISPNCIAADHASRSSKADILAFEVANWPAE